MLKKVNLKKSFSIIAIAVMALVLMFAPASVQAASNPLSDMPTKISKVINDRNLNGTMFSTPIYSSKVKLSVKSSNTKVAKVTGESYSEINWETGKKGYAACYTVTPVSGGTAKIYVKVTVKGKTYSRTCTYRSYKWESPVTNLKIGATSYQAKLNKSNWVHTKRSTISGKVYYRVKPGFTVKVYAYYYTNPKNQFSAKSKLIKNGQSLPKNTYEIGVIGTAKRTGLRYSGKISK